MIWGIGRAVYEHRKNPGLVLVGIVLTLGLPLLASVIGGIIGPEGRESAHVWFNRAIWFGGIIGLAIWGYLALRQSRKRGHG